MTLTRPNVKIASVANAARAWWRRPGRCRPRWRDADDRLQEGDDHAAPNWTTM